MKVLVACEFSATVRDAFRAIGHDAWSCDILPCECDPAYHLQGDAIEIAYLQTWDLMIAHPPCTYLTNSGVVHLHSIPTRRGKLPRVHGAARWEEMKHAALFFEALLNAPIPRIAVENPIPHRYAVEAIGRKYDQIIQPWMFGHGETKATCLWLKGLPHLRPTNIVPGREQRLHKLSPGPDRWRERSKTFAGIAEAMAAQWGSPVYEQQLTLF